jgi:hypothetical protein
MAVWVSGFFGSGKSHFIKILSYLLENIEAVNPPPAETRAAQFFDEHKIKDAMLLADVQRAVQGSSDVILFNIDAKADSKDERDVILQVFLRVFNEKLGLQRRRAACCRNGAPPGQQGRYETFKAAFASRTAPPGMPSATPSISCVTTSCMPWPRRSSKARNPPAMVRQRARDLPHQHRRARQADS